MAPNEQGVKPTLDADKQLLTSVAFDPSEEAE